jgi:glucosamine--fructose-6-phosphate aminotransferase (isomerizing)
MAYERATASHTWKEITSQDKAWAQVLADMATSDVVAEIVRDLGPRRTWVFLGCGTSFYLAEAAATSWTLLTGRPAKAVASSEILLFPELLRADGQDTCAVAISRSGKTSETVRAATVLQRELKVPTAGITCDAGSELEQVCDRTVLLRGCEEQSTVMTRSFTGMLIALQYLASRVARNAQFGEELGKMAEQFAPTLKELPEGIEPFARRRGFADFVFLGQGALHGIAREAALKVMEMSCSYSQPFHTLEFRHGPKAIVSAETCLTFFLSDAGHDAESEVLAEMKELGGSTISICKRATDEVRAASDLCLEMGGDGLAWLAPYVVPCQLLGFFTGLTKGLDPDKPKNLTRVVVLD